MKTNEVEYDGFFYTVNPERIKTNIKQFNHNIAQVENHFKVAK